MTMSCKSPLALRHSDSNAELHQAPFLSTRRRQRGIKVHEERRQQLGGYMPVRKVRATPLEAGFLKRSFEDS